MDRTAREYTGFLSTCKTERETVDWVVDRLEAEGFVQDASADRFYRVMRRKTVFVARKGRQPLWRGFRLLGAHGDTPRLDLKQHPLFEEAGVGLAKTHYYGGIRKHQWLAVPLALHGVIATPGGETIKVVIGEDPSDPVFSISDLLPHLASKQGGKKLSEAFEAEKLNVVLGHEPAARGKDSGNGNNNLVKRRILELLHARYGVREDDLYSAELQMVPAGPARDVGLDGAVIGGYGHDDRICVYAALEAMLRAGETDQTQVVIFWDKEEIGSEGSTSAKSRFFEYCLADLIRAWEPDTRASDMFLAAKAISCDVHGALDPDYQELHDKLNAGLLGYGPCFSKFTGHRGKYSANDAHAEYVAWLRSVLDTAGVPWQMAELGKVDLGGGGTVAKHLAEFGMDIIDCGPPILSMHSPFELASKVDLLATIKAYQAFLEA
jgi:aspartyl aminopeptidase